MSNQASLAGITSRFPLSSPYPSAYGAKGAARVIKLLLDDDAVAPAKAARAAKLSDRASRRLFDRLVELGAVRELTERPSFRLYGL
jgi:Fic family protein